ncbi:MAG TPA: hypothetical protein VLX28_16560 [Thermoanaerobaculia bacterium]|nr:hypothetical protein [Thermoanaerobaculia bacterium]
MNIKRSSLLILILLAGVLASPALAQDGTAALGAAGEVYLAKAGAYKDLFPKGHDTAPGNTVLAVDLIQPGMTPQRLLVPYTIGADVETSPAVLFEDNSNTLFLLWASKINSINSVLMLASFDGSVWGPPIQIIGNPFSSKTSPQLAITHDSFHVTDSSGNTVTRSSTIIHLVWEEQNANGNQDVLYTPVFLEDGNYLGWAPVYNLNDMVGRTPSNSSFVPSDTLVQAPALQSGRDSRTLVVGFASAETRSISAVEINVLPQEISALAEDCRAHIIDVGRTFFPGDLKSLADNVAAEVIASGANAFHGDIVNLISGQIHDLILANRGTDSGALTSLSEDARAHIIDVGVQLSGRGLRDQNTQAKSLVESTVSVASTQNPSHLIHFRVASSRPAPQMGSTATQLFLSETGDDTIVAWTDSSKVFYLQSQGSGWSDQKQINLSSSLDASHAYSLLKQRARSR